MGTEFPEIDKYLTGILSFNLVFPCSFSITNVVVGRFPVFCSKLPAEYVMIKNQDGKAKTKGGFQQQDDTCASVI